MPAEEILIVEDLYKSFDGRPVLSGVNLRVKRGEKLVIMGLSGCGKSTLLKHLIGAIKPDQGRVVLDGEDITQLSEEELVPVKRKFGILFQSGALFNSITVGENVAFPLRELTHLDPHIIDIIVKIKLQLVGLTGFENLMPSQISGGMKKRVGLARAMALDPELIFCDEPGAGLDPITAAVVDQLILDLSNKLGVTIVVVTHEMKSAFRIADRMIMLHEGSIIANATPQEIKTSSNAIVQQFVQGHPDGPIPMHLSSEDYIENLKENI